MRLYFKHLILHNFLSYGHTEINLEHNNYCIVRGVNNDPTDNALSNGAGKSSWTSAICWALTGETIQGLTSNIKNINVAEDSCWVELHLSVDRDNFRIIRYKNPKADLKIFLNDRDISGKGIRESENALAKHLPDLTSSLLASIVILGQGLPNKFTANSPSGRKEVLEKLSKSDFMIQDLKNRISARTTYFTTVLREQEDSLLTHNTTCKLLTEQLTAKEEQYKSFGTIDSFDNALIACDTKLQETNAQITNYQNLVDNIDAHLTSINQALTDKGTERNTQQSVIDASFTEFQSFNYAERSQYSAEISRLEREISSNAAIKDICPTCGQKIPGVFKPDTTNQEIELQKQRNLLQQSLQAYNEAKTLHDTRITQLMDSYQRDTAELRTDYQRSINNARSYRSSLQQYQETANAQQLERSKIIMERDSFEARKTSLEKELEDLRNTLKNIDAEILYINSSKSNTESHITALNQLNNLVKRDFRGHLLGNIINYIDQRAKQYSIDVFQNSSLDFSLNGNNINISYCNKSFENLSGGEKQKVDLIIQFALRDMMQQYLGFSSNILVLDEIFDALDLQGCNNILNLITSKFTDLDSIYIISHRAFELKIPYDTELVVTKNSQGISSVEFH